MTDASTRTPRKTRTGRVVSNAMDKTVVVDVVIQTRHPLYSKEVRHEKKFYAHDADNDCNVGDIVRIAETRPLSKKKRWRVTEIVERAHG